MNFAGIVNLNEEGRSKNRYKELKLSLQNKIKESELKENNHSQLSQYEKSLMDAKKYYHEKYGSDVIELADAVQINESYKNVISDKYLKYILIFVLGKSS